MSKIFGLSGRLLRALLILPLLLVAAVGALWALAHGEAFSLWALRQVPGVTVVGARGALLGDFQAARIDVALPRGGRLWLVSPRWQGMQIVPDATARWGLGLRADRLQIERLTLEWVSDPASPPSAAPTDLRLPVSLSVPQVAIDEARSALWGPPLQQLRLAVQLHARPGGGAVGGDVHQLQLQSLQWSGWRLGPEGLSLRVGTVAPLPVQLTGAVKRDATAGALPGELGVQAQGPLSDLTVTAQARWLNAAGTPPLVALGARLRPFAAWPVAEASVSAHALDLASLQAGWPSTRLEGTLRLAANGPTGLALDVDVRNALAAAWDQGGLPLTGVQGRLTAPQAQQLSSGPSALPWLSQARADLRITLPVLAGRAPATVAVQGEWGAREPVCLTLAGVQPQALHAAAPPLLLQGVLSLQSEGAAAKGLELPQRVQLGAQLTGAFGRAHARREQAASWPAASQPIALDLDGEWRAEVWSVRELRLRAGAPSPMGAPAEARLSDARLRWRGPAAWQAQGALAVQRFDPQVWLPWPQGMTGRNSLSAQGRIDIDQGGRGLVELTLSPSTLAGLPLTGQARWQSSEAVPRHLQADLDVAGNQVHVQGQGHGAHVLDGDWQLNVAADRLQALSPLGPLLGLRQLQGSVRLETRMSVQGAALPQGGWPLRASQGQLVAKDLRVSTAQGAAVSLAATQADWRWAGATAAAGADAAPITLQWQLQGLRSGQVQIDQARATLEGSTASHRLRAEGDGRIWRSTDSAQGTSTAFPAHLSVALDGGWRAQAGGNAWRGRLTQASLAAPTSSAVQPSTLPVFLQVQPTDIVWQQGAAGRSLSVQPTRVQLMGAELALERLRWQGGGVQETDKAASASAEGPVRDAQAMDVLLRLAPLNLPQWLARWQPQAGWGGDLTVGGQLRMLRQPGQAWEIDAELARQAGDITLSEPTVEGQSAQRLGLREARARLAVRNGLWTLEQTLDGRVLGRLSGRQTVQARDPRAWPQADAPLSGEVTVQVASLRPLATWAPAGWRLNGQLQGQAQIGGTLGAPRWSGWLQGEQLALSQSLLGVHLSDGQLRIEMDGERARLTRFAATGGPQGGRVLADGEATLGESPQLQLHVQAERFAVLQRIDRRIVLSGDTQAGFSADTLKLRGQVRIDEGLIDISHAEAPTLGEDVAVRRRPGAPEDADAAAADGASGGGKGNGRGAGQRKVDADIALDLGRQLRLKGHGLDGLLVGQLQVSTPSNKPAIQGVVKLEQGTFAAYGQKLRIERSTITFTGLIDNPRLDILAMRPQSPAADASDVRVGVRITGTALDPRIRLYSEPSLSETEQLSWLVLGRGPSGLGGADIGLLQSAAVALLSGESREGPTDKLIGLLGLDQVSVRQSEGTVRDTVVNVGKQVSRHWYVGYERNLNATGGNWQLIYSLAQRFKLRAQAGEDNAVDLIWQWRWD